MIAATQTTEKSRQRTTEIRVGRRTNNRSTKELLLLRSEYLPADLRAILRAHLDLGMPVRDIAILHRMTPRMVRRRLDRLSEMLADPCFILAAQYAQKLPNDLPALANAYWMQGRPLRELAALRGQTLHAIRRQISLMRSLLLMQLASQQEIPNKLACQALDSNYVAR